MKRVIQKSYCQNNNNKKIKIKQSWFFFPFFWSELSAFYSVLSAYTCLRKPVNAAWDGHVAGLPGRRLIEVGETQQTTQSLWQEAAFQPANPFLSCHLNF